MDLEQDVRLPFGLLSYLILRAAYINTGMNSQWAAIRRECHNITLRNYVVVMTIQLAAVALQWCPFQIQDAWTPRSKQWGKEVHAKVVKAFHEFPAQAPALPAADGGLQEACKLKGFVSA